MQYQVDPTDQTPENGQKPFLALWIIQKCILVIFEWSSWPDNVALSWKTFSTITICNIKSIQQTKIQKMAKNLFFGSLDHSKMQYCAFWMILHDLVMLRKVCKHLLLSQDAISSRSNRPNSRKWPKTYFLAFCITQKCVFVNFEWSFMTWQHCRKLEAI